MPQEPPTRPNKTTRKELEPFQRGLIIGRFLAGQKTIEIHRETGLPYSTIQTTINRYQSSTTGTSSPRNGRPGVLSDADKRFIHMQIKRNPDIKTAELCKLLPNPVSSRTITRMLKESAREQEKSEE